MGKNLLLLLSSILISLLIGEMILRHTEQFANYCEKTGIHCPDSEVDRVTHPWLWTTTRNLDFSFVTKEFSTTGKINSEGFLGKGFTEEKSANAFRILFLGDSFTFGIGASEGNGFVEALAKHFETRKGTVQVEVMNAGTPGSDPVFHLQVLKRQMLKYKPDLVVMLLNDSDIEDLSRRGGIERFNESGFLKERERPWFAPLFRHSMLVRGVFMGLLKYSWDMISPEEQILRREMAVSELIKAGVDFLKIAQDEKFEHLVLFHPYPNRFSVGLLQEMHQVADGFTQAGVRNADITKLMTDQMPKDKWLEYYWPIDLHFNDKGYLIMANAVLKVMEDESLIPKASE